MAPAAASTAIDVLVIEDHELLSSALEIAFDCDGRVRVVGTATTVADGLRASAALQPQVVLCDRRLPDGDIEAFLPQLLAASPASRVLVMTGWPTQRSLLEVLDAGAHGIVSKALPFPEIVDAITRVHRGDLVIPAGLAQVLLRRATSKDQLSRRELDVLEALATGESTEAAARRLCISHSTARNHLAHAMLKLGVHDRLGAVTAAIRLGLVSPALPETGRAGGRPW